MRPADLAGFGPVNTNTPQTDEDIMRDVYMTRSQREAYERICNRSIERDALAARVAELESIIPHLLSYTYAYRRKYAKVRDKGPHPESVTRVDRADYVISYVHTLLTKDTP